MSAGSLTATTRPTNAERLHAGYQAERLVAEYLELKGLEVVATNVRVGSLEIDIVAREGPVIVVVEVRSRSEGAWTSPFGSLRSEKRRRVRRAGQRLWDRRFKHDPRVQRLRFDAASVSFEDGKPKIEYARAAF